MGIIKEVAHTKSGYRRYCRLVRSKSAGSEPLSIGPKQLAENDEPGIGRLQAHIEPTAKDDDDDDDHH